jgi:hypothetical protein
MGRQECRGELVYLLSSGLESWRFLAACVNDSYPCGQLSDCCAQLLRHVHECGVQGATVDWPDIALTAVTTEFQGVGPAELQLDS